MSGGGRAIHAGVIPTPGVAVLVRLGEADLGCVISASHNPYQDNGIKLFAADGFKLHDDTEHEIEGELGKPAAPPERVGRAHAWASAAIRSRILATPALASATTSSGEMTAR